MKKLTLLLLIFTSLIITGCFSNNAHRRGKLSDAMNKSSSSYQGRRLVDAKYEPDNNSDQDELEREEQLARQRRIKQLEDEEAEYWALQYKRKQAALAAQKSNQMVENTKSSITPESADPSLSNFSSTDSSASYPAYENARPYIPFSSFTGVRFGSGMLFLGSTYGINSGEFLIGSRSETSAQGLTLGFAYSPLQQIDETEYRDSTFEQSLSGGVFLLNAGLDVRLNPQWKYGYFCPYFIIGGKLNMMFWDYKNAIEAPVYNDEGYQTGTEMVRHDFMVGLELYTGIGINIVHNQKFELGVECQPGAIIWMPGTYQGFDNDVFPTFTYTKFGLHLNFFR